MQSVSELQDTYRYRSSAFSLISQICFRFLLQSLSLLLCLLAVLPLPLQIQWLNAFNSARQM